MCQQELSDRLCQYNLTLFPCLPPSSSSWELWLQCVKVSGSPDDPVIARDDQCHHSPNTDVNVTHRRTVATETWWKLPVLSELWAWTQKTSTLKSYSAVSIVNCTSYNHSHTSNANISLTKYLHNFYNQMSNRKVYLFWRFVLLFHYLVAFHQALFTADKLTSRTSWLSKASVFSVLKDSS